MKPTLGQKILQFRLTRILIALIAVFIIPIFGMVTIMKTIIGFFPNSFPVNSIPPVWMDGEVLKTAFVPNLSSVFFSVISSVVTISLAYLLYRLYVRKVEKRSLDELNGKKFLPEISLGILIGSILLLMVFGVEALLGYFKIVGINFTLNVLPWFLLAASAGFMEELIVRGIMFRILEEKLGTWITLALTAAIFGALHAFVPGATLFSIVSIALSAGLILGAAYIQTRRLWLPIGIHFAWDAILGGVFGIKLFGVIDRQGIFISEVSEPTIFSGIELSDILMVIFGIILAIILLYRAHTLGKIIKPFWIKIRTNDIKSDTISI